MGQVSWRRTAEVSAVTRRSSYACDGSASGALLGTERLRTAICAAAIGDGATNQLSGQRRYPQSRCNARSAVPRFGSLRPSAFHVKLWSVILLGFLAACGNAPSPVRIDYCRWRYVTQRNASFSLVVKLENVSLHSVSATTIAIFPIPGAGGGSIDYDILRELKPGATTTFRMSDNEGMQREPGAVGADRTIRCQVVAVKFADGTTWKGPPQQLYP